MSPSSDTMPTRKRPFSVFVGVIFSLFIGALALLLAILGFQGKGGAADISQALPNLITGIASLVGAAGYLALKKWAVPVYAVAVIGHFVSHTLLLLSHSKSGHITGGGIFSLLLVPVLALIVLIVMERQRRSGLLR